MHKKLNTDNDGLPTVSVIIPTYNREKFIKAAVESVLKQSFTDFEIIIVDDGSKDSTKEIIASIKDPRLIYVYQDNKGRSNARNNALSLAKGRFITFLDSDDLYLDGKLELQVKYLETNPDFSMVYTSAYCINESGELLKDKYVAKASGWIYIDIAFFTPQTITLPTVMVRREVFDKAGYFDEKLHRFEDTDMWRRISKHYKIQAMPEFTCALRTHGENHLINQKPEDIKEALQYYANKIFEEDNEFDINIRKKRVSVIYRYYSKAFFTVPHFRDNSREFSMIADSIYKVPLLYRACGTIIRTIKALIQKNEK